MRHGRSLAAALDPVLTSIGFLPAYYGSSPEEDASPPPDGVDQPLWCSNYQELQGTHPWLPQATGQDEHGSYACVDLMVTITDGVVTEVDFDAMSLAATFSALGRHDEAEQAARVVGAPVDSAAPELARLLAALFRTV